ncbi:hypothetical protein ANN_25202 [Periplaneta americana]|uniref:Reverse transcriptase n=1 Tax=Periplaneta americana TaxID=6978 RepID=A0ABQ8S0P5_PERAM|nr:hypothetical protein ANN_25202 [Periplaneta americana]
MFVFSDAGNTVTKRRAVLNSEHVNAVLTRFLWPSKVNVDICSSEKINTFASAHISQHTGHCSRQEKKRLRTGARKKHKGKGVLLYQQYTPANKWIRNHKGNVSAVRSVPDRSSGSNLCRRCDREVETLAHVLGVCPHGELLRNTRHHTVRSVIATALRYKVYEEVYGISSEGSNRRIDIIAFKPPSLEGYIIDPTVRFESHEHQPEEVHEEKRNIYGPSISFYKDKYHLESIIITGLMIRARGIIPRFPVDF